MPRDIRIKDVPRTAVVVEGGEGFKNCVPGNKSSEQVHIIPRPCRHIHVHIRIYAISYISFLRCRERDEKKVCKEFELLQNENRWMNYSRGNIRLVWLLIWWSQSNDTKRKLRNKPNIRDVKHMAHAEFMLLLILHPLQGPLKSCLATGFLKSCFTWGKRCVLSNLENTAGEATLWEVPGLDWISFHADKNQWSKRNGS